jgi:uncharacterized pyridoxal phosphate-containing UPF0001 family protein
MRVLELPGFGGQRKVGENQAQSASEKQNGDSTQNHVYSSLFDHLIGERQHVVGNFYSQALRSLEVNDELELSRLHDG